MQEFVKNFFYLGAGLAFMTKEKIEELKKDLIDRGKMTQDEGKQFVDDLVKKSEQAKADVEKKVREVVAQQMEKIKVASTEDIAGLRKEIEELRGMLEHSRKPGKQ
jgi:polyhydroxyalkanoate synthesis regulator phasin